MGNKQLENARIEGNKIIFTAPLISESSFYRQDLGTYDCTIEFGIVEGKAGQGWLELTSEMDGEEGPYQEMGVWFDANQKLIDYDGCFELPQEAVVLLEHLGYNCDYVKNE
jgi:hypothetical protein